MSGLQETEKCSSGSESVQWDEMSHIHYDNEFVLNFRRLVAVGARAPLTTLQGIRKVGES